MQCGTCEGVRRRLGGFFMGSVGRVMLVVASVIPYGSAAVVPMVVWPAAAVAQDEEAAVDEAAEPAGENMLVFYYKALGLR